MIDWHSHILPGMDDGSRDVPESLAMLQMQSEQGVQVAVATPHFYANDESVDHFLQRRQQSFDTLSSQCPAGTPEILLGAEVRYYQGISRWPELKKLCVQGTRMLLLEMPMCRWTEYMVRELLEIASMGSVQLMMAHIERYLPLQNEDVFKKLQEYGVLMQVNASFFQGFGNRRKALSLLRMGWIHAIGSDCHNTHSRPPKIQEAFAYIEKKMGTDYLHQMDAFGRNLLELSQ